MQQLEHSMLATWSTRHPRDYVHPFSLSLSYPKNCPSQHRFVFEKCLFFFPPAAVTSKAGGFPFKNFSFLSANKRQGKTSKELLPLFFLSVTNLGCLIHKPTFWNVTQSRDMDSCTFDRRTEQKEKYSACISEAILFFVLISEFV